MAGGQPKTRRGVRPLRQVTTLEGGREREREGERGRGRKKAAACNVIFGAPARR